MTILAEQVLVVVGVVLVLALLVRVLTGMPRQNDVQVLRLLCEQGLAGQRAEAEQIRTALAAMERAVGGRLDGLHAGTEQRLGALTTQLARDHGQNREHMESKLREMADSTALRLGEIQRSVNEQLTAAVERQMTSSFGRVIEQFSAVQKSMADVAAVTAQIGDLKRVFSNVKSRGGWGETQLKALLDDLLPEGSVVCNARLREQSGEVVEFAVRMPMRGDQRPLLAIDAKFPISDYERLLDACELADADGERTARRALEVTLRTEAAKIASKYILPPVTVEFAVMYLPTDALYAEAARVPGLIDELGQRLRVMVMGPSLLPALLRTVQLGYVTLALEQKAGEIGQLLGATKREMLTMDSTLEKLAKHAGNMTSSIEEARKRTRVVTKKLKGLEMLEEEKAATLLAFEDAEG